MKPFDIEKAKAGHPVCTRDGRKARIICFDAKSYKDKNEEIIALVTKPDGSEYVEYYTQDGRFSCLKDDRDDLMMASEKKTGWINIYPYQGKERVAMIGSYAHKTQKEAKERACGNCIATIPIEWEE